MKHIITSQQLTTTLLATAILLLPALALAHGEVADGHIEIDAAGHHSGGSELLKAWSSRWWGLLAVATLLSGGLSYLVWKYLQVEPIKKAVTKNTDAK